MIKDTTKLEEHIKANPTDSQAVITLLKTNSDNVDYLYELEQKRKQERMRARKRKLYKE